MTTESLAELVYCLHESSDATEKLIQDLVQLQQELDLWETRQEIIRQTEGFRTVGVPYSPVGMGTGSRNRVTATLRRQLSLPPSAALAE